MAGGNDTGGLTTALQLLGAAGVLLGDGGEAQEDLFEAAAPLPLPLARPEGTGKAGRPKGARNRSTDEWVNYYLGRYRSPLTALGELYSRDLRQLVDDLQKMADTHKTWRETKDGGYWERVAINPLDVLKMQRDAAVAMLPYIHKRQPIALEVEQRQRGVVVLGSLDVSDLDTSDDLALPLPRHEENQQVTDARTGQSDDTKSDDATKASDINGMGSDGD